MQGTCPSCHKPYDHAVIDSDDLERAFDYSSQWEGVRFLCPDCRAVLSTSFGQVKLADQAAPAGKAPAKLRAVIGPGPQVMPFPKRL